MNIPFPIIDIKDDELLLKYVSDKLENPELFIEKSSGIICESDGREF